MRIVKSLDAERDLTELFDYIATDSGVERAEVVLRRIDDTLTTLAAWPGAGRERTDLDGTPRAFSLWPWMIVYEPHPSGEGIFVWRILDGRRDIASIIETPKRS